MHLRVGGERRGGEKGARGGGGYYIRSVKKQKQKQKTNNCDCFHGILIVWGLRLEKSGKERGMGTVVSRNT